MNETAYQGATPAPRKKRIWLKILGAVVAVIVVAIGLAFYFTSGMVGVVEKYLELLRQGDFKGAYALTSKDFQKSTSLEQFSAFIKKYPSLSQNQGHSFSTRSIENNIGKVKGSLTARDGAVTPVEFHLVKEQGEWRILFMEVRPTGTGVRQEGPATPASQAPPPPSAATPPTSQEKAAGGPVELLSLTTCESVDAADYRPVKVTNRFAVDSPEIHVVAKVKNNKAGAVAKAVWIAVDAVETPNYEINTTELVLDREGSGNLDFKIKRPARGWPPGKYKMDLFFDGKLAGSAPFTIGKASSP